MAEMKVDVPDLFEDWCDNATVQSDVTEIKSGIKMSAAWMFSLSQVPVGWFL